VLAVLAASLLLIGTLLLQTPSQWTLLTIGWPSWACWLAGGLCFVLAWRQ